MLRPRPPLWAGKYIGLPFVLGGRTKEGCDCWGLVKIVLEEQFGIVVPSYDGIWLQEGLKNMRELARFIGSERMRDWEFVRVGEERPGDVIVLKARNAIVTHVGLVYARGEMLHSDCENKGCLAERYDQGFWAGKIEGIWQWKAH